MAAKTQYSPITILQGFHIAHASVTMQEPASPSFLASPCHEIKTMKIRNGKVFRDRLPKSPIGNDETREFSSWKISRRDADIL
jgi:hypothetical protein